jgi:PAS domain-containing protein
MKLLESESPPTRVSQSARSKPTKPGLRALEACGDGFWEFDLIAGTAWFNDWFYRKLDWRRDTPRSTLVDLQPALRPDAWDRLMRMFRDHLEKGLPLDLVIDVNVPGARLERWHMRGGAARNEAGQPVHLAGSVREIGDEPPHSDARIMACLGSAFDALPVAAALLDSHAIVIVANQLWRAFSAVTAEQAIARLRAANSQTAIEFWLDDSALGDAIGRQLRVRAVAFQHDGSRHLAVTLEDHRRSD